ncbi:homoserine O-succinyltransferase [Aliiglaciecola sp. LCG003]|uniref:homoserine O-acetyltransferase MetA n=1 Tax=Aliiglaciecola sp. LCG003 TaxID=3053655 RepID=UPI0025728FA0|nr:homoserine O-succinyltransferase [Aliiglaciecola sp. LCG003]WJG08385.1 homoserine O-succinyltransferase [Aliiglaciecola sp. LCG003]
MPIRIPNDLPAQSILDAENIFVMDSEKASRQDIRPLEVGILNLMPNKIETEVQILRLMSNTPLQVNIDLIRIDNQAPKNTPKSHMDNFYLSFDEIAHKNYDGFIITGAPIAHLDYADVKYWDKITTIMDWTRRHVQSTLYSCWAAHAAFYHYYGFNRELRAEKLSGVFEHKVNDTHDELVRGFDPYFSAPHSRYGEIPLSRYEQVEGLKVLASSQQTGAYIVASEDKRTVLITGHPEYDPDTLDQEYHRDLANSQAPNVPQNYYQNNDPTQPFKVTWRAHGTLLFTNWLNYYVYQTTPYNLDELPSKK